MTSYLRWNPVSCLRAATAALFVLLFSSLTVSAQSNARKDFAIEAGDAASTLKQFAQQSGAELLYSADVVEGVKTHAVKGEFTPKDALELMVVDTPLVVSQGRTTGGLAVRRATEAEAKNVERAIVEKSGRPDRSGKIELDEKGEPVVKLDTFEVFGRKTLNMDIQRTRDDVQPYVVFDRQQIERSGATSLGDYLKNRLPQNIASLTYENDSNLAGANRSTVNLRGLGAAQTLVLVDGRRLGGANVFNGPGQTDLNGIPISAVERVEVLPTTASAIYGGGATGGVVNIILRRDYAGAEIKVSYENTMHADTPLKQVDLAAGFTSKNGKTNVLLSASYATRDSLLAQDTNLIQRGRAAFLANNPAFLLTNNFYSTTPNIRSTTGANLTLKPAFGGTALNARITHVPVGYAGIFSDNAAALVANAGRYNLEPAANAYHAAQRTGPGGGYGLSWSKRDESFRTTVRHQFSDKLQVFAEAALTNRTSGLRVNAALFPSYTLSAASPANPFQQAIAVTPVIQAGRFGDGETINTDYQRQFAAGLIFKLSPEWQMEMDYTWSSDRMTITGSPFAENTSLRAAVESGALVILRDMNVNPTDMDQYLTAFGTLTIPPYRSESNNASLRVAGSVFELPAGKVTLNALLEHRRDALDNAITYSGSFTTGNTRPARSQAISSGYLEAKVPLLSPKQAIPLGYSLEVQTSVRWDRYDVKGAVGQINNLTDTSPIVANSTESTTPLIGLKWLPVPDIVLRASYARGFLPPSFNQLNQTIVTNSSVVFVDPKRGFTSATSPTVLVDGNPNLRPEKSESWSAGFILQPRFLKDFRFSVDYTRIHKTDNITSLTHQVVIDNEDALQGSVKRGPKLPTDPADWAGPVTVLDIGNTNISRAEIEAYDVQLDWAKSIGELGSLKISAIGTWQTKYRTQLAATTPLNELVGITSSNPLKFKGNLNVEWTVRRATVGWSTNYFDSYWVADPAVTSSAERFLSQGGTHVASQTYHDVYLAYRFTNAAGDDRFLRKLASGTELIVGMKNVFNEEPPLDMASSRFYSPYGDPRGARYFISVKRTF